MTDDQNQARAQERHRAADDVAKDMERRLEQLDEDIHDAEKRAARIPADPASGLAGDATAVREGPHSPGATPRGTEKS